MNLDDSPTEAAFRAELRAWLEANAPTDLERAGPNPVDLDATRAAELAWHRKLHAAGYTGLSWPTEVGGRGLGPIEDAIFAQEAGRLGVSTGLNYGFVARAMLLFATPEQQRRFLPGLLSGETSWCQGFSEPDAGSDLASLRTRAVFDATIGEHGGYRITGQKTWTSFAQYADLCLCLVRTGDVDSGHRGISAVVIDMKAPGIEVRTVRSIRDDEEFCEVFFDDTPVPAEDLVGEPGQGWSYALVTLTYERGPVDIGFVAKYQAMASRLWEQVQGSDRVDDTATTRALARSTVAVEVLRLHCLRSLSMRLERPPGPEGSVDKLLMAAAEQSLLHAAMEVAGGGVLVDDADEWFSNYLYSRAATIYGGTAQIQRNVIAERCLGLPR